MTSAKHLVIVGGVAAGTKTAARARRLAPGLKITLLTDEAHISYAGCGEPYFVGDVVPDKASLLVRTPESFAKSMKVDLRTRTRATEIDSERKVVKYVHLDEGEEGAIDYDYLVLATGARPVVPPLPGVEASGIYAIRTVDGVIDLKDQIDSGRHSKALVVGGGFIGIEMAENMAHRGLEVTLVEKLPHVASNYDEEVSLAVEAELRRHGIAVLTGTGVAGFESDENGWVKQVNLEDQTIEATLVVMAIGVRPNTEIAVHAGIEVGPRGAVVTNERMETNLPGVYAAGDCAQTNHRITGEQVWIPLGDYANQMGRVIGTNIALLSQGQEPDQTYPGVIGTNIFQCFDLNVAGAGLTVSAADRAGLDYEACLVPLNDKPTYMPGVGDVTVKLIADRKTEKILGVQAWGRGQADKVVDTVAGVMVMNGTVDDLCNLDLAYAPPFSPAFGNAMQTAMVLQNKLKGRTTGILPREVQDLREQNAGFVFLDVRNPNEFETMPCPVPERAKLIPLPELPERVSELDPEALIITSCGVGIRAAQAYRVLKQKGFSNVKYMDGGCRAWPYWGVAIPAIEQNVSEAREENS